MRTMSFYSMAYSMKQIIGLGFVVFLLSHEPVVQQQRRQVDPWSMVEIVPFKKRLQFQFVTFYRRLKGYIVTFYRGKRLQFNL
jgi:hypothetical protein